MGTLDLETAKTKFLAWVKLALHPDTLKNYERYLNEFISHVGNIPLAELSPSQVLTWSAKFHRLQAVQRLASWCYREARLLSLNPLEGMKLPPTGQRNKVLSRREIVLGLRGACGEFRHFLLAMRETMCRPQEARAFTWANVRELGNQRFTLKGLAEGRCFFLLEKFKGKARRRDGRKVRIVPIPPRLGRLMVRLWASGRPVNEPVLRNTVGKSWTTNATRCQMRCLRESGCFEIEASGERVVCYSLRHTGATNAVSEGVRDMLLAELLGHASTRTTQRYVHLQPEHLLKIALDLAGRRTQRRQAGRG